ncbi:MAG: hypothetical protein ABL895_05400 [Cyclobacteriaceae bacterium]
MIRTEVHQRICPYTGLRSFTEDESLYFKGRDLQIQQITSLLEQNRFLMVTGASGEGKSSVVYAGLVPNARAGFFKAKHTNWIVADFRPERAPLHSMAIALADKFDIQTSTAETELRRGFSSLVDLYSNSEYCIDETDEKWLALDEQGKRNKKRKAANLMILVDQFEEFFTNPENFYNSTPSQDSQIVVNLILETARIALKRGLPIYVVCTMRSDYIGQCSAFRGLAEYIGFSQFFVPRLKRKDLKQVIEEPAILSDNRISQRLIERLVYDLVEGIDQLPILQHALSQIWLEANEGLEEMDLIHYAKVGGMPGSDLPDADQTVFNEWFLKLSPHKKALYTETGLDKVIAIHANILYESAHDYYTRNNPDNPISQHQAKRIVALSFACLTKIDNSRAVRNRMSLEEIATIINDPALPSETVGKVLDIFREKGNSFIRPFKTDDSSTHRMDAVTVLDITHESLIRSWDKLNKWVKVEYEFYSSYLDFKKQLDRWKKSRKSSSYLLPIGPLTFFEAWYQKCKPNAGWIGRYTERAFGDDHHKNEVSETLFNVHDFLKQSARKVMVTRAFMKYGSQRIVAIMALLTMVVLSGFYWQDATQKQNENVIEKTIKESHILLASEDVSDNDKAIYLITEEQFAKGSLMNYLNSQSDFKSRTLLAINGYLNLLILDKKFNSPVKEELISFIHINLMKPDLTMVDADFLLDQRIRFIYELAYDNYYNASPKLEKELNTQSSMLYGSILDYFSDSRLYKGSIPSKLNQAIQLWLTFGAPSADNIASLIDIISPFANEKGAQVFSVYYPKGSFDGNGIRPLDYNGGYHMLASLYAAAGKPEDLINCLQVIKVQPDYFSDRVFNNFTNIIGYLYQFDHRSQVEAVVSWVSRNSNRTPESIYNEMINRSAYMSHMHRVNFQFGGGTTEEGSFQLNLCMAHREFVKAVSDDYENLISKIQNSSERNFLQAIHFKRKAIFRFKNEYDRELPFSENWDDAFSKSIKHFESIDEKYLAGKVQVSYPVLAGVRTREWTRKELFTYPDYIGGWLNETYHSDIFFKYLKREGLLDKMYSSSADLNLIHYWITNAFEVRPFFEWQSVGNPFPLSDSILNDVLSFVSHHHLNEKFDKNLIYLVLANRILEREDSLEGIKMYKKIDFRSVGQWVNKYENVNKAFLLNEMRHLGGRLAALGLHDESVQLAERFENADERVLAYVYSSQSAYVNKQFKSSFVMLDSANSKAPTIALTQLPGFRDFRYNLIYTLTYVGGKEITSQAKDVLREMNEGRKFGGTLSMVDGYSRSGELYKASASMPITLTENQELVCKTRILWGASSSKGNKEIYLIGLNKRFDWDYVRYGNSTLN